MVVMLRIASSRMVGSGVFVCLYGDISCAVNPFYQRCRFFSLLYHIMRVVADLRFFVWYAS